MHKLSPSGSLGSGLQALCMPFSLPTRFLTVPVVCESNTFFRNASAGELVNWRTKLDVIRDLASISSCLHCGRSCVRMQFHCAYSCWPAHTTGSSEVKGLLTCIAVWFKDWRNNPYDGYNWKVVNKKVASLLIWYCDHQALIKSHGYNFSYTSCKNVLQRFNLEHRLRILKLILMWYIVAYELSMGCFFGRL